MSHAGAAANWVTQPLLRPGRRSLVAALLAVYLRGWGASPPAATPWCGA